MSAIAHAQPAGHHSHADDKFKIFVNTAMILAVITGVEIGIVYVPWAKWVIIAALVVLSVVKFMMVIFIFMHLHWDKMFCTILFFIGLVLSVATVWALLALFGAEASLPLTLLPIPPPGAWVV